MPDLSASCHSKIWVYETIFRNTVRSLWHVFYNKPVMIGAHVVSGLAFIWLLKCVQLVPYRRHVMYLPQGWIGLIDVASAFHSWFVGNVINPFKSVNAVSSMMESSSTMSTMMFILWHLLSPFHWMPLFSAGFFLLTTISVLIPLIPAKEPPLGKNRALGIKGWLS